MLPHEFATKWARANLKESAASQEHFLDLCHLMDHATPAEADADGSSFTFEKGAKKTTGRNGFADVWKRGFFAWEYKGRRSSLAVAYQQLQQYREDLENPPLLVVCDLDRFEVHTNFTNTPTQVYRFATRDIAEDPRALDILRAIFFNPEKLRPGQTTLGLTEEAAAEFARLADMLRARGIEPQQAAHFLTRVIFCLFSEDVGLLPRRHFSNIADQSSTPEEFTRYTQELFQAMAHGGRSLFKDIAYFNGNLFTDGEVLDLTLEEIGVVRKAGRFDWSSVEPAIFGTLFERSLDPSKRSQIGAHYTHPDDIRAVVEPVLMAPLRREWEEVRQKVADLADRQVSARGTTARRLQQQMRSALLDFVERLAKVRILDPACGSGNFLYISMNLLKDLEKEVITFAGNVGLTLPLYQVTPAQLYGLEINSYAQELAQTAIWIGYIQWHQKNGFPVQRNPVLHPLDTIRNSDAILDLSDPANPKEPDWPDADVIVGNPPFLGNKLLRTFLGSEYVNTLFSMYDGRVPGGADLVCYWFEKAQAMIDEGRVKRVGLLATQGIRGGANRRVLQRIKETGDIFLAYSDRPWILEGAAVHVSIIGFDDGSETYRTLDEQPVTAINSNLTVGVDLTRAKRLRENVGVSFIGDMKKGKFEVDCLTAQRMLAAAGNPNGLPNSDVLRTWVNGLDVTGRPRNMWIIDFPIDSSESNAAQYETPFEYVKTHVKPARDKVRNPLERRRWWVHGRTAPDMREALQGLSRYIATARVAKHRLFVFLNGDVLADGQLVVVARDDNYAFGVLHSRPHELWALAMGTQLREKESGFRYTPTTTFETFPFSWPLGQEPADDPRVAAITEAARELDRLRESWLNPPGMAESDLKQRTLTSLYNARPTWLTNAHEKLDRAVLEAYGWPYDVSDEELLARLLALNGERSG